VSHYYDFKEWKYPSVTTIIGDATDKSGALCQWSANQVVGWIRENIGQQEIGTYPVTDEHLEKARFAYKETSQTALDVGSAVHAAIEDYLHDKPVVFTEETPDQVQEAFAAFRKWEKEHDLKPIALEQTVFGDCWAGTLDFLGYFNDKLYVIDWKSSKAHYPEMRYQVAAYRSIVQLPAHSVDWFVMGQVQGCGVLRLDKETGLPDWKDTSKTYERDLQIFTAMKQLYFLRHPQIAKKAGWHTPF